MDWELLAKILSQGGMVNPALFHGDSQQSFPVPQQSERPRQKPAKPSMSPYGVPEEQDLMPAVTPYAPPPPTRNPMRAERERDATQGYIPAGGFGATGPISGMALERRLQEKTKEPMRDKSWWDALSGAFEFQPHQPIINMPERSALDKGIEQAVMMAMPIGRLGAGVRGAVTLGRSARAARAAGTRVPNVRMSTPKKKPSTLTEELQLAHRNAKRAQRQRGSTHEYSAAEKARVRKAALSQRPARKLADQLYEKGRLDQDWGTARGILY